MRRCYRNTRDLCQISSDKHSLPSCPYKASIRVNKLSSAGAPPSCRIGIVGDMMGQLPKLIDTNHDDALRCAQADPVTGANVSTIPINIIFSGTTCMH